MKWYVKAEDGDIWGPMSKTEAENMRDQIDDACIYDERIFLPQFITSNEAEESILALKTMLHWTNENRLGGLAESIRNVVLRTIDTITLLSREPQFMATPEIDKLRLELLGLRDAMLIIRQGENDAIGLVLKRASDALANLSRKKVVTGSIEGGVFNIGDVPEGVSIDIRDYDVEGMDEESLKEDENGSLYFEAG